MATRTKLPNLTIEDARLMFRNFKGAVGAMNNEGNRNFCVFINPDLATAMIEDGWNVKQLKPREEGDIPQDYIKIKVNFAVPNGVRPPQITLISSRGQTKITEDMIDMLDWAELSNADLIISAYFWENEATGRNGITAYLQSMYVKLIEDELELKYANIPDSAAKSLPVGPTFIQEEDEHEQS